MPKDRLLYLGNCIRTARISCGLTQQELADQLLALQLNTNDK